jgi:hypothetical protein
MPLLTAQRRLQHELQIPCRVAKDGCVPGFSIDGRPETDLLKLAAALPEKELSAERQRMADLAFIKKQSGYRRTGYNLAHRSNQIASDKRARGIFDGSLIDAFRKKGEERHTGDVAATAAGRSANA